MTIQLCVYADAALGQYHFGVEHPFGPGRYPAFYDEFMRRGLAHSVSVRSARVASVEDIARFHTRDYINKVQTLSELGEGVLDYGDTPAVPGIYEAAATVVGTSLDAMEQVMTGDCTRAFVPIAGLHHASPERAAGFCVFNDVGVVIESLRARYGIQRIAYVDIDAHHGDGVFYAYVSDPNLIIADMHEDGRHLYPGTGHAEETGQGQARGSKLNIPLPPGADDEMALDLWEAAEDFIDASQPEFILLQCGADSLDGDPITHLKLSGEFHAYVARRLVELAGRHAEGRILAMGGGGYAPGNIAEAWNNVIEAMLP
ncbi:MAG: acetoin utilization protein AcuC [Gammaproteobacteria bacterium]|nr:acetoin utilization protein AcuC [Gammaproteobacteria bacterium]